MKTLRYYVAPLKTVLVSVGVVGQQEATSPITLYTKTTCAMLAMLTPTRMSGSAGADFCERILALPNNAQIVLASH